VMDLPAFFDTSVRLLARIRVVAFTRDAETRGVFRKGSEGVNQNGTPPWLTDEMDPEELAFVIHEAVYKKRFSLPATRAAMARANGRRNLGVLEEALRLYLSGSAGTRSRLEKRFRRLVRGAGYPQPRANVIVNGFEVDFYWPGLCVEVDGAGHARPRSRVDDRIRDAALQAAGYTVLRFSEDDLNERPTLVLAELAAQRLAAR
jgi:very-short-patch-repair endonuclease